MKTSSGALERRASPWPKRGLPREGNLGGEPFFDVRECCILL